MALPAALPAIPNKIVGFVKESREELRRVSWPTRQTTVRYALIVIGASLGVGFVIGGIDFLLTTLIERLLF